MKSLSIILVVSGLLLSACNVGASSTSSDALEVLPTVPPDYAGKSNPLGASAAVAGAVTFKTDCVQCHGDDGKGDGPASTSLDPRPANLVALGREVDDDFLYWRITTGVPGTAMPAWKGILSEQQIWELVAYIRTLK